MCVAQDDDVNLVPMSTGQQKVFKGKYHFTDENGESHVLEILCDMDFNGKTYYLFVPANIDEMDPADPDYGYIILEAIEEDGEEFFYSIEDEDELNSVYEMFMALIEAGEEEEEE